MVLSAWAAEPQVKKTVKPIALNTTSFTEKVFDYNNEKEWKYKGDKPAIIDFWARVVRPLPANCSCFRLKNLHAPNTKDWRRSMFIR